MEEKNTFMNVLTDFAFKRLFGTEERKTLLIRFLNILFKKDGMTVTDVIYHDKEILPHDEDGKVIKYDVYCTSPKSREHFIVEMQQIYHVFFENRAVFYTARGISDQLKRGARYDLSPVYSIFIIDFNLPNKQPKPFHDVRLMDFDTHEVFSDKMRMVFISLTEAKKMWEECVTEYDKIVYLIKNMHYMDKESNAYKSGEYSEFFDAADMTSLVAEEMVAYSASKLKYQENLESFQYSFDKGKAEGKAEGFDEGYSEGKLKGLSEGKARGLAEAAKMLIKAGQTPEFVHRALGLPLDVIKTLMQE